MSVRSAGKAIKEARLKAGLTQEKLSEGICSVISLSRIENGSAGVSPSTFQALMARAGVFCEAYPAFANRTDFDCFYTLKRARFYIDAWQFAEAFQELEIIVQKNWANNRFYYQEWLLLQYKLQFHNQNHSHLELYHLLIEAIQISCPDFLVENIQKHLLSVTELELIISVSQEYLYLNRLEDCYCLCEHIENYIHHSQLTSFEKERLLAQLAIVSSKYFIATKDYAQALATAEHNRHQMVKNSENSLLYELSFLTALGYYYTNDLDSFSSLFRTVFYSCHAIGSCYATTCKSYVEQILHIAIDDDIQDLPEIPYQKFENKKLENTNLLQDGIFDYSSCNVMYFGDLIRELRTEQNLSQQILCQGLCSKSKLSKIENNYLQPDIALSEALLQRLGISERVFTFWEDEREKVINEYKYRMKNKVYLSRETNLDNLHNLEQLISPQNTLHYQYLLLQKMFFADSDEEQLNLAYSALYLTLPDFVFSDIKRYRLTWVELTLLNNICILLDRVNKSYTNIIYYNNIIEYTKFTGIDIIFNNTIYPITISYFIRSLYLQNHETEILTLMNLFKDKSLSYSVSFLGIIFGFYCQALGANNQLKEAKKYANYSNSIFKLTELFPNSKELQKCMFEDYNIRLFD